MDGDWVKKVYDDFMDDPFGSHPYSISRMKDIVMNFMSRCHKTYFRKALKPKTKYFKD